jgi:hypothetical protein
LAEGCIGRPLLCTPSVASRGTHDLSHPRVMSWTAAACG